MTTEPLSPPEGGISRPTRRGARNHPLEFKLALAKRACDPSVSVAKLARENGLNANLLFKWRLKYQRGEFGGADNTPILLPVRIQAEAVRPDASPEECDIPCTPSQIEIDCGGFTVKLTGPVNGHDLDIVIDCLTSRRP